MPSALRSRSKGQSASTKPAKARAGSKSGRAWCDVCRGDIDAESIQCTSCPRRFHQECCAHSILDEADAPDQWQCPTCTDGEQISAKRASDIQTMRKLQRGLRAAGNLFLKTKVYISTYQSRCCPLLALTLLLALRCYCIVLRLCYIQIDSIQPFVAPKKISSLQRSSNSNKAVNAPAAITGDEPFIHAQLRDYQVAGVGWIIDQYKNGCGGILADEVTLTLLLTLRCCCYRTCQSVHTPLPISTHAAASQY